jgi:hypothetical protein
MACTFDIGVVVPLYNKEETVAQAVEALLAQTVRPAQIVVVNDGCTDRSVERLAPLRERIALLHQPNAGCSAARNSGIAELRTEWIALADADNVWHPDRLEHLRAFLVEHPEVDWVSGQYRALSAGTREETLPAWCGGDAVLGYFEQVEDTRGLNCADTLVMRRSLFEEIGGFPPRLRCHEVTFMYLALALRRPHMGFLGRPSVAVYLGTPGSLYDEQRGRVEPLLAYCAELVMLERQFAPAPAYLRKLIVATLEESLFFAHRRGDYETMREVVREYGEWLRPPVRWKARVRCGLARLGRLPARAAS